jgi:hypothetical protein
LAIGRPVFLTHEQDSESDYNTIKTVCVTPGEGVSGSTLYEVQKVDGNFDPPRYQVFQIWCLAAIYTNARQMDMEYEPVDNTVVRKSFF